MAESQAVDRGYGTTGKGFLGPASPIRVYTASKLRHSPLWKRLCLEWPEVYFTARWPLLHCEDSGDGQGKIPDEEAFAKIFWEHDLEDVLRAQVVLVYSEDGEALRGALVEAGMALATGRKVIVVGEAPCYGTWQFHSSVHRVKDLAQARILLHLMTL